MNDTIWRTSPQGGHFQGKTRKTIMVAVVVLVMVVGMVGYEYLTTYSMVYSGEIVDKERSYRWWRGSENMGGMRHKRYNHYIIVETDSGEQVRGKVSHFLYNRAEIGDRVIKEKWARWPYLADEERAEDLLW